MRFFGQVGYGESTETPPDSGKWVDVITEYSYRGDVVRKMNRLTPGETLSDDLRLDNSISIVADEYARQNVSNMRYVVLDGNRWKITSVDIRPPRLILSIGEVYNGPTP